MYSIHAERLGFLFLSFSFSAQEPLLGHFISYTAAQFNKCDLICIPSCRLSQTLLFTSLFILPKQAVCCSRLLLSLIKWQLVQVERDTNKSQVANQEPTLGTCSTLSRVGTISDDNYIQLPDFIQLQISAQTREEGAREATLTFLLSNVIAVLTRSMSRADISILNVLFKSEHVCMFQRTIQVSETEAFNKGYSITHGCRQINQTELGVQLKAQP